MKTHRSIVRRPAEATLRLRLRTPPRARTEPEDPAEVPAWIASLTDPEVLPRRRGRRERSAGQR